MARHVFHMQTMHASNEEQCLFYDNTPTNRACMAW